MKYIFSGQVEQPIVWGEASVVVPPTIVETPLNITSEPNDSKNRTLTDQGIYLMFSPFTSTIAKDIVRWILEANLAKKREYEHLTLMINSPGGDVNACFSIIDAMRGSSIPVHTTGVGMIASCGLLTFIAGEKGHRILTPNTSILSHQWSWGSYGKEHELVAVAKEFNLTTDRIVAHYKKCTGLSKKKIRKKLLPPQDIWLSAEEAKELNVCDEIKILK